MFDSVESVTPRSQNFRAFDINSSAKLSYIKKYLSFSIRDPDRLVSQIKGELGRKSCGTVHLGTVPYKGGAGEEILRHCSYRDCTI